MILVTGANGFVGRAVLARAARTAEVRLRAAFRSGAAGVSPAAEPVVVGDLGAETNWASAVEGVTTVVHTAARVHMIRDSATDPLGEFRRINVEGTLNLARQAVQAGVRRFVFLSSIKVNGEQTLPGQPYTADDEPRPVDAYGISKYEAEEALGLLARQAGIDLVIIRPTLVYGPGVKGNFLSMMRWLDRGVPMPFGAIGNRRSLVAIDNLADLIVTCTQHPAAANQTFLVSDGEDVSTTALMRSLAKALHRPARLIPVPAVVLRTAAILANRQDLAQRLCSSLQVDISKTRRVLGWEPLVTLEDALAQTARHFRQQTSH